MLENQSHRFGQYIPNVFLPRIDKMIFQQLHPTFTMVDVISSHLSISSLKWHDEKGNMHRWMHYDQPFLELNVRGFMAWIHEIFTSRSQTKVATPPIRLQLIGILQIAWYGQLKVNKRSAHFHQKGLHMKQYMKRCFHFKGPMLRPAFFQVRRYHGLETLR